MVDKKRLIFGTILALLVVVSSNVFLADAERITIEKPFTPVEIEEGSIPLPNRYQRADPLEIQCRLEAGHLYHIFLVGEWVGNESRTDYDIEVFDSQNVFISGHTEAKGMPEQVANDKNHQYFVPSQSDIYRFVIHNDPEDSEDELSAVFMIIEHLEMNKKYELYLEGRPSPSQDYPDGHNWAYEFSTSEEKFQLHIEVPDPNPDTGSRGLDMYEARIYPMANPAAQIGYNIWGVGVPTAEMLTEESDESYGGYNFTIEGKSIPELRASCEYAGEDMDVTFGKPFHNETELVEDIETKDIFYYMVMLAEYYQGTISFYMKTDYRDINVTIVESPEIAITGRETRILVDLESPSGIDEVWLNYTTDDWKTEQKATFESYNSQYVCWLPRFDLLDQVQYRIYAEDEIDNSGTGESSFIVMDPVNLHIETQQTKVYGGESMEIRGEALPFSVITLNITKVGAEYIFPISVDDEGEWVYSFKPPTEGIYTAQTSFEGDDTHPAVKSKEVSFTMAKHKPLISYIVSPSQPKKNVELEVKGATTPPIAGASIKLLIVSETESFERETTTKNDGKFTLSFTPEELGSWQILPQVTESTYVRASSGEIKEFQVIEMTTIEKITVTLMRFTVMPLMVVPIGLVTSGIAWTENKMGIFKGIMGKVSKKNSKKEEEISSEKQDTPKGATSYRRRSSR